MNPLTRFDRIYVINLPARADRRAEIQVQLQRVGLALDRAPVRLFPAVRPDAPGPFPSIGARGCFLSHLGVLKDAAAAGCQRILIFEDDLDFSPAGLAAIEPALHALDVQPWGMFYGGYRIDPMPRGEGPIHAVAPDTVIGTTHFVGLNAPWIGAAAEYLDAMLQRPAGDPNGGPMHVDGAYSWLRAAHPEMPTWVATPELGDQRPSRTDIHDLRWYDAWPGVRNLAHLARRLRARR
ncbi:MAG TPA: glycosyltransferase family 25 protein [Burkholderiaceae bacterium]